VTLLKAIQAREATSLDAVLKQLKALRDAVPQGSAGVSPALPAPAPAAVEKSIASHLAPAAVIPAVLHGAPAPLAAKPAATALAAPLVPLIAPGDKDGLLTALLAKLPLAQRTMLSEGRAVALTDKVFTIGVSADHFGLLDPRRDEPLLTAKLSELGVGDVTVKLMPLAATASPESATKPAATAPRPVPTAKPPETKPAKAAPVQLDKADFINDPLIQQAVEIFKATLVEVRAPGAEA
jgi:hypothetical protein